MPAEPLDLPTFPAVSYAEWRQRVDAELGDADFASLRHEVAGSAAVQPLYSADRPGAVSPPEGAPGEPPFVRGGRPVAEGRRWRLVEEVSVPEPAAAAAQIAAALERGSDGLRLTLDRGVGPTSDGVHATTVDDLRLLLAAASGRELSCESGGVALAVAALAAASGATLPGGGWGGDPLAALALDGTLPGSVEGAYRQLADLAAWSATHASGRHAVLVSASPYHDAGAAVVDELAFAAAGAAESVRRLVAAGLDLDAATAQIELAVSVSSNAFLEIAKLRALRWLWSKLLAAHGAKQVAAPILARSSSASWTGRAPHLNLLRGTAQGFAAAVGGADAIAVAPWDAALGLPSASGLRLAAGTGHLLSAEAGLDAVGDPAGGSWYLETLTEDLARAGWDVLRQIEGRGGIARCLADGWVGARLAAAVEERRRALASGDEAIVGVTRFPRTDEPPIERPAADLDALRRATEARAVARGAGPDRDDECAKALAELEAVASAGGPADGRLTRAAVDAARAGAGLAELVMALAADDEAATAPPVERVRFSTDGEARLAAGVGTVGADA